MFLCYHSYINNIVILYIISNIDTTNLARTAGIEPTSTVLETVIITVILSPYIDE